MENLAEQHKLTIAQNKGLTKLEKAISLTNKLIFNGVEKLFNEAFYLINSKHLESNDTNYCFKMEYEKDYLKRMSFKLEANSDEDYEKAVEILTEVIRQRPDFKFAYYFRGYAKKSIFNCSDALDDFSKTIEIDPLFSDAYFYSGEIKHYSWSSNYVNDLKGAIADYSKAIDIDSTCAIAYFRRGEARARVVDICYDGSIGFFPNYDSVEYEPGWKRKTLLEFKDAIDDLTKAIELDPKDSQAYYVRAKIRYHIKNFEGCIIDFSNIISLNEADRFTFFFRGKARIKIKDYIGAFEDFSKAIEINSEYVSAIICLGNVKGLLQDYNGAFEDFSRADKIQVTLDSIVSRGVVKNLMGDFYGAIRDFNKVKLSSYPNIYKHLEIAIRNLERSDFKDK